MLGRTVLRLQQNVFLRSCRNFSGLTKPFYMLKSNSATKGFFRRGGSFRVGYRCNPPDDPIIEFAIDAAGTIVWCYMFYMIYYNHSKVTGYGKEFADNIHYTDAELGIEE